MGDLLSLWGLLDEYGKVRLKLVPRFKGSCQGLRGRVTNIGLRGRVTNIQYFKYTLYIKSILP